VIFCAAVTSSVVTARMSVVAEGLWVQPAKLRTTAQKTVKA